MTLSTGTYEKTSFINSANDFIKKLRQYSDFECLRLSDSKYFMQLVLQINQTIRSDQEVNNIFENKLQYYESIENEINLIIKDTLTIFREELKKINVVDLEKAKTDTINNYNQYFQENRIKIKIEKTEFLFNRVLSNMSVKPSNDFTDKPLSAQEMINSLLEYDFKFDAAKTIWKDVNKFIEKFEQFNIYNFYINLNDYIKYNINLSEIPTPDKNKLSKLLILSPRMEFINAFIEAKAVMLYFKYKGIGFPREYDNYNIMLSLIDDYVNPLITTLEQLKFIAFPNAMLKSGKKQPEKTLNDLLISKLQDYRAELTSKQFNDLSLKNKIKEIYAYTVNNNVLETEIIRRSNINSLNDEILAINNKSREFLGFNHYCQYNFESIPIESIIEDTPRQILYLSLWNTTNEIKNTSIIILDELIYFLEETKLNKIPERAELPRPEPIKSKRKKEALTTKALLKETNLIPSHKEVLTIAIEYNNKAEGFQIFDMVELYSNRHC